MLAALLPAQPSAAQDASRALQLEVYINDAPANVIGSFTQLPDRRMAARRAELTDIGIKLPDNGTGNDLVIIDGIEGIAYRYDEPTQRVYFVLIEARRVRRIYDARGTPAQIVPPRSDFGAVLNYTLFASSTKPIDGVTLGFSGANATLDGRLFGRLGTLSQSAILGTTTTRYADALRLDTTWTYSDTASLMTYRAGDTISGGLAWTRSIRLAGVQVQHDFSLRPDLVTMPLPTVSGSAAVPSTVDVYVNSVKTYSQEVPSGPYQVNNLPTPSAAGTAVVMVRDAAGHQTQTALPFYTSPKLLKDGLLDFSVEAGVPRVLYGVESNAYVAEPVASATLRAGLHDWLTVEAHAEGGAGLINGGIGATASLRSAGIVSVAASGSSLGGATGSQGYVAFDTVVLGLTLHASSLRTFAVYNDLASATARDLSAWTVTPGDSTLRTYPGYLTTATLPKALDNFSVGIPLPFDKTWLNLGYVHLVAADSTRSDIITASYSRSVWRNTTAYVTAFADVSSSKNSGIFAGLSVQLNDVPGGPVTASASVTASPGGSNVALDAGKSIQPEPGSYGWRVRDSEGATPYRYAGLSYRSSVGQVDGYVQQAGTSEGGSLQLQGAIATAGGGVFFSNRIDDSFAVVDAGAPGVEVLSENRPAGRTNSDGQLLIPSLRSYQNNKISIDARDLPLNAEVATTQETVVPANRGGVAVSFGVKTDVQAAVVILTRKDGGFLAPGTQGRLDGTSEMFVVGYDGRAYVKSLGATNVAVLDDAGGECRASFPFTAKKDGQAVIGPVVCQ